MELELVAAGAIAGAVYGYEIYQKKKAADPEVKPDWVKLGGTVILGAAVGAGIASTGVDVDLVSVEGALVMLTTIGGTAIVENTIRLLFRLVTGPDPAPPA